MIARLEHGPKGANPRFVVTNLANVLDRDSFFPPSHCIYFTPGSLTQLLSRHGFSIFRKRLAFKPGIKVFARRL